MSLSGILPAVSRRAITLGSVAALACLVTVSGLQARGLQDAAAQQAGPPDPLKFTTAEPRLVFLTMTADGEAAFEAALGKAKEVMAKPDAKPELKTQAAHWKVTKSQPEDGAVTLFFFIDQTVPNQSYNPFAILSQSGMSGDDYKANIQPLSDRVNAPQAIKFFKVFMQNPVFEMSGGGGH